MHEKLTVRELSVVKHLGQQGRLLKLGVLTRFNTCREMRVFAGSKPPWRGDCTTRQVGALRMCTVQKGSEELSKSGPVHSKC